MIDLKNVDFSYSEAPILSHVTLSIAKGEFIGVFGPNGGGKTTFLKLLMGFLKPRSGSLSICGSDPTDMRKKIGYVPQLAQLDKQFPISVLEVVLMGCLSQATAWGTLPKKAKQKAKEALATVGLLHRADDAFGTLSGGQAQRVLIARALASNPDILILDEPTASVDAQAESDITHLLVQLKGTMTIIMVSHDLQMIISHVDRLLCVQRTVNVFLPNDVCGHFSLGLYHPPLTSKERAP